MKQTPTLSQLINSIQTAGNDITASNLFQELYARIKDHFYKAFYGMCYKAFTITEGSMMAEEAFYVVLEETEADIRAGKFTGNEQEDEDVLRRLLFHMVRKAYWRMLNGYERRKRQATVRSADLTAGQHHLVESISSGTEYDEEMAEAERFVFGKLTAKDADIIRTFHCSTLTMEEAQEELMKRYRIPSDPAFARAVARAKERFKDFLQQYQTGKIPDK